MPKADGLKHGRPQPTLGVMCNMECSRFAPCPITEEDAQKWQDCKAAYKAHLKEMQATKAKLEAKQNA